MNEIKVKISLAWWFKWYLYGVVFMSCVTKLPLDEDKLKGVVKRAIRLEVSK